jgi:hypothetical protein
MGDVTAAVSILEILKSATFVKTRLKLDWRHSWVLPDVILKIFPEMLDPVPRRSHRLHVPVFFVCVSGLPH